MKRPSFLFFLPILVLAFPGCATAPRSIWPDTTSALRFWHEPKAMPSPEAAIGTLKNMQKDFVGWEGYDITQLEVDAYGLRAKAQWVETSTQSHYVPNSGGYWVGSTYVPYYGGTTQYTTSQTPREDSVIIPFNEVQDLGILHYPNLPREYKWGLNVELEGDRVVSLRLPSEFSAKKMADAVATLAIAQGKDFSGIRNRIGIMLDPVTPEQKAAVGLGPGDGAGLVTAVWKGSRADLAGLQALDVLVKVDGRSYADNQAFIGALRGTASPSLTILRRVNQVQARGNKQVSVPAVVEKEIQIMGTVPEEGSSQQPVRTVP